jgi:hypothetical protein
MEVVRFYITIQWTQHGLSIIEILFINFNWHNSTVCWIDVIILEYHFNNYWIITLIVLPNSEPYNKLFTTTEDGHLMAETRMAYK